MLFRSFDKIMHQLKIEVGRIEERVSELLDYARPRKPDFKSTDVREVIEDSLKIVTARAADAKISIEKVFANNSPDLKADREYLRSLFSNLFINAVKAMEPLGRGLLRVEVSGDNGRLTVVVSDDGPGISPEDLSRIFEPYFSVTKTGTGLGLAIVQKVVEIHKGRISVESQPGRGARFIVVLPVDLDQQVGEKGVDG